MKPRPQSGGSGGGGGGGGVATVWMSELLWRAGGEPGLL